MGTRGTVHIYEEDTHLVSLYVQFDSYPQGLGEQLALFIKSGTLVNGIPGGEDGTKFFNGAGCFAAALIKHLKEGAGGVYVIPEGDEGEEYNYTIRVPKVSWSPPSEAKEPIKGITIACEGHESCPPCQPDRFLAWVEGGCLDGTSPPPDNKARPIRPVIPIPKE